MRSIPKASTCQLLKLRSRKFAVSYLCFPRKIKWIACSAFKNDVIFSESNRLFVVNHSSDDSWLNLSEDDLQGILSQYSHPNSSMNGTECGTKAQDGQRKDVSIWWNCRSGYSYGRYYFCMGLWSRRNEIPINTHAFTYAAGQLAPVGIATADFPNSSPGYHFIGRVKRGKR